VLSETVRSRCELVSFLYLVLASSGEIPSIIESCPRRIARRPLSLDDERRILVGRACWECEGVFDLPVGAAAGSASCGEDLGEVVGELSGGDGGGDGGDALDGRRVRVSFSLMRGSRSSCR